MATSIPTPGSQEVTSASPTPDHPAMTSNLKVLQSDIAIMLEHAVENGISLPTSINLTDEANSTTQVSNYNELVKAIAPSTVKSIRYIKSEIVDKKGQKKWFQIPVFNKCLVIAVIALIALIGVSLSPNVNEQNQSNGLLASSGMTLFLNLLFICSASLLGVMFYLLKTISTKIKNYTLLPVDNIEINASIIIGVISGFIISELVSFSTGTFGSSIEVNKMTFALLGGFSADAIFTTLQGIVNKLKMLVSTT